MLAGFRFKFINGKLQFRLHRTGTSICHFSFVNRHSFSSMLHQFKLWSFIFVMGSNKFKKWSPIFVICSIIFSMRSHNFKHCSIIFVLYSSNHCQINRSYIMINAIRLWSFIFNNCSIEFICYTQL